MIYKRGDIIWLCPSLHFELGNNVQSIRRPYVIISNNVNNRLCPTINIACLTNQDSKADYPMHVLLSKNDYKFEHNSVICVEQILTVNKDKIIEKVGSLTKMDLERLNNAIYIQLINEKGIRPKL